MSSRQSATSHPGRRPAPDGPARPATVRRRGAARRPRQRRARSSRRRARPRRRSRSSASPEGIVVRGDRATLRGGPPAAAASQPVDGRRSRPRRRAVRARTRSPARRTRSTTTSSTSSRSSATRSLLELPTAPLCRDDCAGSVPELRCRPQRHGVRLRHRRTPIPGGRPCGRSNSELRGATEWPSRSARRAAPRPGRASRRTCASPARAHSLCPNCGASRLPHTVCGNCGWYRGRQVLDVE